MAANLESLKFRRKVLQKMLADLDWELDNQPADVLVDLYNRALELLGGSSLSDSQKREEFCELNRLRRKHELRKKRYSLDDLRHEVQIIRAELDQIYHEIEGQLMQAPDFLRDYTKAQNQA
jgi:hypothetical protein